MKPIIDRRYGQQANLNGARRPIWRVSSGTDGLLSARIPCQSCSGTLKEPG
jgi:hypothetical protein